MSMLLVLAILAAPSEAGQLFDAAWRRRKMAEYADCIVKDRPGKSALIVLRKDWKKVGPDRDLDKVVVSQCVPNTGLTLSMPIAILQFALADALIRAKQISLPVDLSSVGPLDHGDGEARARAVLAKGAKASNAEKQAAIEAASATSLSRFGECVVRAAPAQVTAFLRTEVASSAETSAVSSLSPALGSCIDTGQKVEFSREALRGVVAYNYFRLAAAAGTVAQRVAKR